MNRIKTSLPAILSSLVFLLFTACGGGGDDTDAQPIKPDASGSELQKIAAEMQKGLEEYLGAQVDATVAAATSGQFDLGFIQALLGSASNFDRDWIPQKYNEWHLACSNPQIQPTTGMTPAGCVNSFWHTLASLGISTVVNPLASALPTPAQAAALATVINYANSNPSSLPPYWISAAQTQLSSFGFH
ncbi:MAG: hypothetical protein H6617_08020 [Bdellovibrionaceae bacterium]|nr:hypothetical protein [Bdellovibrionales bacterium]MCB9254611.1 hypothetical protein [Pseudobdellovibrionaceae bacterium]